MKKRMKKQTTYKIYKTAMIIILTAFITFIITSIGMYKYIEGDGKISALVDSTSNDIAVNLAKYKEILNKYYLGDIDEEKLAEGHTLHATEKEALDETIGQLKLYERLGREVLAIPFVTGKKTEKEKFAGAVATYTIEALMKDGQALQSGTSHFFGQGFCEHFGIKFLDSDNTQKIPWQTSWGVSTRLIGAVIMVHGDDNGLVLPPYVAPVQVMIIPIKADKDENVAKASEELLQKLLAKGIRAKCDFSKKSPGWKFSQYEMKGVPVRIEVGPRDLAEGNVVLTRRVDGVKKTLKIDDIPSMIEEELKDIHETMYNKALDYLNSHIVETKDYQTLGEIVTHGKGYAKVMWCGDRECEDKVKADYNASSRCMPFDQTPIDDKCVVCGKPAKYVVLFDRAY